MSDSTLNRFVSQGSAAERDAHVPDPASPGSGPEFGYFWYERDTGDTWAFDSSDGHWFQVNTGGSPGTHASTHQNGGGDEISVAGLSGLLADDQNPTAHASDHQNGGGDEISVTGLSGLLADAQTPTAHATSHEVSGSDELDVTSLGGYPGDEATFLRADGTFATPTVAPLADQANFLQSGGQVVWESGFQFRVSAATYVIGGVGYTSAEQTVVLDAADGSDDRIDSIYLDTALDADSITGTPSSTPSSPSVDPETQLLLAIVTVPAAATEPDNAIETIYLENAGSGGGEWNWTASAGTLVLNSTNNPRTGTTDIEGTTVLATQYVEGTIGAGSIEPTDYDFFVMFARPKAAWANGRGWSVRCYAGSVAVGAAVTVTNGVFGFDSATLAYQQVAIPMASFALPAGTLLSRVRITKVGSGNIGFYLDDIGFVGEATTPGGGNGITQEEADARYAPLVHATRHKSGGADAIKLDELAAPTDVTTLNASTSAHGLVVKATAPSAGLLSAVGIGNGETAYTMKPLFDTTNPAALGVAAPGTQLVAARRDHVHLLPTPSTVLDPASSTRGAMIYRGASTWDALAAAAAAGYRLRHGGSGADPSWVADEYTVNFIIGDGTNVIAAGSKGHFELPQAGVITAVRLMGDASGTIVVDLNKATYSGLPTMSSICASAKPTLAAQKYEDTTMTGWTLTHAAGDWIEVEVEGTPTVVKRVTVALRIRKTT